MEAKTVSNREWIAEFIYTEKNKYSIRTPEAPKLPTWLELHDKTATLAGYNERLVERYLKEADAILAHLREQVKNLEFHYNIKSDTALAKAQGASLCQLEVLKLLGGKE